MLIDDEYRDSVEILGDLLDAQTHVQNPAPVPSFAQRMDDAGSVDILSKLYDEHAADQAVAHELSQETAPPPSTSIDLLSEAAFPTIDDQHDHAIEHAPQYSPAQFSDEDADALVSSMERRPHHVEIDIETDGSSGIDPDSLLEAVVRATSSQPHNQHTETEIDDGDESGVQHGYGYAPMSTEILGALVQQSAAFNQYAEQRVAANVPTLRNEPYRQMSRDWQIDFGPASAPAGEVLTLYAYPQCLFRGEKVIATDTGSPNGYGTRISTITVGQKVQRPGRGSSLTAFFANNALGNGIKWDTTNPAIQIAVTVSFIQSCTFDMTVLGRAVV